MTVPAIGTAAEGVPVAAPPHRAASGGPVVLRAVDGLGRGFAVLSGVALLSLVGITCYDVALRYLFDAPTDWATEITGYLLVAVTFFGLAYAHLTDSHIRVELILGRLAAAHRAVAEQAVEWLGLVYAVAAGWQAALLVHSDYVHHTRAFTLLLTPTWMPETPIPIGLGVFALAMLGRNYRLAGPIAAWRGAAVVAIAVGCAGALWWMGAGNWRIPGMPFDWGIVVIVASVLAAASLWSGPRTALLALAIGLLPAVALYFARGASYGLLTGLFVLTILYFLLAGVRVSLALGLIGLLGVYVLLPMPQPLNVATRIWASMNSFTLKAVPMFLLMSGLLLRSGLSDMVFGALSKWLGGLPGGLAHAGIGGCALFAAVSGSSVATAATIGTVACPAMIDRGYSKRLAYGSIASGGTLGTLLPPSIPMILYAATVGVPIANLFVAGIIPGLMVALLFSSVVFVWALLRPEAAPAVRGTSWGDKLRSLREIAPICLLILGVLGSLYGGVATATEAGALGAVAALAICLARRRLSVRDLVRIVGDTIRVTAFLFLIIAGASVLTFSFDYLRLAVEAVREVAHLGLGQLGVMMFVSAIYIGLGMFIDSISMMIMTLPVVFPVITAVHLDPLWFGVMVVLLIEGGLITPPIGMNLYVLRGISRDTPMTEIVYGTIPFHLMMFLSLVIMFLWPQLALWLPRLLG